MIKLFNWNLKLWVTIIVIIAILAGVSAPLSKLSGTDTTTIVISRVNTEGSGIFGDDSSMVNNTKPLSINAEKWKGKVVGTPGFASIQDVIIKEQIKNAGLKWEQYQEGRPVDPEKVSIWPCGFTTMKDNFVSGKIQAGIVWEPFYSEFTKLQGCYGLCTTGELQGYENHACCVISVNSNYLNDHRWEVINFLAGYVKAVDWMNNSMNSPEAHAEIVKIAMKNCSNSVSEDTISDALKNVRYVYNLDNFVDEYASLINNMMNAGQIKSSILNPESINQFAKNHVDSRPLDAAVKLLKEGQNKNQSDTLTEVKVACLPADIHQLALHVAIEKGFFKERGISISLNICPLGPNVLTAIIGGESDIGFAGAPPTVVNTVNMTGGTRCG
ncbi:MAG: ABC transporter substrate-binding protein [archaeon]|nr:ABC transporter substrate-binding protein [archaeon]